MSNGDNSKIKILVGKPGLDGHSNGAEQIAVKARDSGMEVVYAGIRLTPSEIELVLFLRRLSVYSYTPDEQTLNQH